MARILFLITAADHGTLADGFKQPAGFWAEEALGPYAVFKDAGHEIGAATPGGVPPTADALSLTPDFNGGEEGAEKMKTAPREATELADPIRIEDVRIDDYDAVFVPGGWGPMEDLADAPPGRQAARRLARLRQDRVAGLPRPGRPAVHRGRGRHVPVPRLPPDRVVELRGDPERSRRPGEVAAPGPPRLGRGRGLPQGRGELPPTSRWTAHSSPARTPPRPSRSPTNWSRPSADARTPAAALADGVRWTEPDDGDHVTPIEDYTEGARMASSVI